MGLTIEQLSNASSVGMMQYWRLREGLNAPRASTLAKLNTALHRFKVGVGAEAGELAPAAAFKVTVALVALALNSDARAALDAQPARRATFDPVWKEAARCREIAYQLCNGCLGFRTSDVARAAGVTKSAVSQAIRKVNDARDEDRALDAVLNRLEGLLS